MLPTCMFTLQGRARAGHSTFQKGEQNEDRSKIRYQSEGKNLEEEGRRKKEEGRRKKGEGRRKKGEGRRKKGKPSLLNLKNTYRFSLSEYIAAIISHM